MSAVLDVVIGDAVIREAARAARRLRRSPDPAPRVLGVPRTARPRVFVFGWLGDFPLLPGLRVRRRKAQGIFTQPIRDCDVVVLGQRALESPHAADFATALWRHRRRILLCPKRCDPEALTFWTNDGRGSYVPLHLLATALAERIRCVRRPSPSSADLGLPSANDADAVDAFAALDRVPLSRPDARRNALRWSHDLLLRVCRRAWGWSPREVRLLYVEWCVRAMRRDGATWVQCAALLGFSGAATLQRAVRRARVARASPHRGGA